MGHETAKKDPMFWSGTENLSGHSVVVLAKMASGDKGPWGQAGGEKSAWVAAGLRKDSGIVDVGIIRSDSGAVIGMMRPDEKAPMAKEIARGFGRAFNPEIRQAPGLRERLGLKIGAAKSPQDFGVYFEPVLEERARSQALAQFPEHLALAFGAAVRAHPNVAPVVDRFEGHARLADIRHPGVVSSINAVNGARVGTDGKVVRDPFCADIWSDIAQEAPGVFPMLQRIGASHRMQTITAGAPATAARIYERVAEATMGHAVSGDDRERAGSWVRLLGHEGMDATNRKTLIGALDSLSKRDRQNPEVLRASGGFLQEVAGMAAAVRLTQSMDSAAFTTDATDNLLRGGSPRLVREVGQAMMRTEAALGTDPLGVVRGMVAESVVGPATRAAIPVRQEAPKGLDGHIVAHAQYGIIGHLPLKAIPGRIEAVFGALQSSSGGHHPQKGMGVLFQEVDDQKLAEDKRAVAPAVRRMAVRESLRE